jgi:transposase
MYIERVPNRTSPPAVLLRESFREGGRVRKRTLANLSHLPDPQIEALRIVLKGGSAVGSLEEAFDITRSQPHGHVAAILGTLRRLGLVGLIDRKPSRLRDLSVAMIAARIVRPRSKFATARGLSEQTLASSLGDLLGVQDADEDDLYEAMDWLVARQEKIENKLAHRHLSEGTLVLYDVSSSYFEGHTCPLARLGHSRDGRKDKLQIVFGLITNAEGCPVAVEVFEGSTGDPKTLASQIQKIRGRFGMKRVVLVGDRGMITEARIREELRGVEGLDWITALRAPAIRKLVDNGSIQLSLFDEKSLVEITDPAYPGERLVVCRNPLLAEERARKREDLLQATERELNKIVEATRRENRRLSGKDQIALRVGKVIDRFKVAKHFHIQITEKGFGYERKNDRIAAEAALDGIYVIRTSVVQSELEAEDTVAAYKRLSVVERAFRSLKTVDLKVRPIYHHLADRVRAHVFLCMLAYYVEWHMRKALKPLLFDDDDPEEAKSLRGSIVAPAQRSQSAQRKASTKCTKLGMPVQSFQSLLDDLATLCKNRVEPKIPGAVAFDKYTEPTALQQRALDLLQISHRM